MQKNMNAHFFFFNVTATTEIYTLSLHDALPISARRIRADAPGRRGSPEPRAPAFQRQQRSEEHTSELQSHHDLVCRLLLEKKKQNNGKRARHCHYGKQQELRRERQQRTFD